MPKLTSKIRKKNNRKIKHERGKQYQTEKWCMEWKIQRRWRRRRRNSWWKKPFFLVSWRLKRTKRKLVFGIDLSARSHVIYIRRIISIRPYARKINNIERTQRWSEEKKTWNDPHFHYNADRLSHYIYFWCSLFSLYRFEFFLFSKSSSSIVQLHTLWKLYLSAPHSKEIVNDDAASNQKNVIVSFIFSFSLSLSGRIAWYSVRCLAFRRFCRYKCFYLKCLVSCSLFCFYSDYSIFIWKSVVIFAAALKRLFTFPFPRSIVQVLCRFTYTSSVVVVVYFFRLSIKWSRINLFFFGVVYEHYMDKWEYRKMWDNGAKILSMKIDSVLYCCCCSADSISDSQPPRKGGKEASFNKTETI